MRIQHNIMAMNAYRNYNSNVSAMKSNLEKLSSGYKINRAGDDAAGLAISEKMRAQITGLNAAQKNVKDGISLVQTAEGAMQEVQDMLNRMVYLATQSANGTYDNEVDRNNLQKELNQLRSEIDRISDSANFNGIKLLDGSKDSTSTSQISADSAISGITTTDYAPNGASDAFTANYITNRPAASTSQTNASFVVKFDDITVGAGTNTNTKYEVKIGDATLTVDTGAKTAISGKDIATALLTAGKGAGGATESANGATEATKVATSTTAKWDAEATGTGAYVKIDGHWWKMSQAANTDDFLTFTQVDYTGDTGEIVNPDYAVSFKKTDGDGKDKGTVNWNVQTPVQGTGVGSSHQAQVSVDIDFSKLKDGDVLTVGEKNYVFKIGSSSTTTAGTGQTLVDLSTIFKTDSDMADAAKQEQAIIKMANTMNTSGSTTWSVGNAGAAEGKGTLTFQSLSTYVDDASAIGSSTVTGAPKCNMTTEANVMKQFYGTSKEAGATASFELDVTKLKAGDTITIDGKVFEFTDGTYASAKENIAVDLSSLGISGGIMASQTADVMNALKTAIDANCVAAANGDKYTVAIDGNKMTLTSKDVAGTTVIDEKRVSAKIELPETAYAGEALTFQIGDTAESFNQLKVNIGDIHCDALGIDGISIATQDAAADAVQKIKDAINTVSSIRGDLGATQNRLEHTANNLSVMQENIQDAESSIRDTDVAEEMMSYTKNNILIQAAQAMLAQANQVPQGVLQLLQ